VSFGGSSLLMNAVAAGILLNVSRQAGEAAAPAGPEPALTALAVQADAGDP
jgi:hypothetical protein